jgi:predicted dehydrogenase
MSANATTARSSAAAWYLERRYDSYAAMAREEAARDDDANILLRMSGGAKGTLVCSQVACGEENGLAIRVYGSKGGLEWHQQEPNTLILKPQGSAWQHLRTGRDFITDLRRVQRGAMWLEL